MPYEVRTFGKCKFPQSKCMRVCKKQSTKCFSNKNMTREKAVRQLVAIQKKKK